MQTIEKTIKTTNPVSLSLYNYIKYYQSPGTEFSLNVIDSYFRRLLSFDFWIKEYPNLQNHIKTYLSQILSHQDCKDLSQSLFLQNSQLISVNLKRDWLPILHKYAKQKNIDYRIFDTEGESCIISYSWKNGNKAIQSIRPVCYLDHGKLKPVSTDEIIYFDSELKLLPFQMQHIKLANFQYARFEARLKGIQLKIFKGYSLQLSEQTQIEKLEHHSKLYYAVKRFESLITGKEDNSMYQKLCDLLEQSLDLVRSQHPESVKLAFLALERGKNAIHTTFPNDKLLQILIKELSFHLEQRIRGNKLNEITPE